MIETGTYQKLLTLLEERTVNEERSGLEISVKRIPDSDGEGELDPRVFDVLNVPDQEFPELGNVDVKDVPFDKIREMMGWPNTDVTTSGIQTIYQSIEGRNGSIPIRIYTPKENVHPLPCIVYFHGGGFIGGSVDTLDNPCKALAEKGSAVVVSVDYRLAPEHPFPAGLHDCYDVVEWVYQHAVELHVNRNHIAVSGDSAGGNLATTVSMLDRDLGTNMIKFQALIYPVVDLAHIENEEYTWSVDQYKINKHHDIIMKGFRMRDSSDFLANAYLMGQTEILHPYVSPLFADDLSGLPEALIITAEFDTLRPEAEAYTKKLQKFGVSSQLIQYNGMDHGFIDKIGLYPQAEDCMSEIVKGMKAAFKLVD